MTCNPFTSLAAKNSNSLLRPENIDVQSFEDLLSYEKSNSGKFNKEMLNSATRCFNDLLNSTDLRNFPTINEKLEQAPVDNEEFATFLLENAISIEAFKRICDTEKNRRNVIDGNLISTPNCIKTVRLVDYPRTNTPGMYKKIQSYNENGPGIIRGKCKATINSDGSFKGTIFETSSDMTGLGELQVSGSGSGTNITSDNMSGTFKVDGIVTQGVNALRLEGTVKGGSFKAGPTVFNVVLTPYTGNKGYGASFNVVIGNNGIPIITLANTGTKYNIGDRLILEDLDIIVSVSELCDKVLGTSVSTIGGSNTTVEGLLNNIDTNQVAEILGGSPGDSVITLSSNPIVPTSDFLTPSFPSPEISPFVPDQPFIDFVNSYDVYLDENYGASIASGACGSSFLGLLSSAFDFFKNLDSFSAQLPDLRDIWNSASKIALSVPATIAALGKVFENIINNLMNKARQTINNVKQSLVTAGRSVDSLAKEIMDAENFYSDEAQTKLGNLSSSIIQRLSDQFKNPSSEVLFWMINRLCQMSDFISSFVQSPANNLTALVNRNNETTNSLSNISNNTLTTVTRNGGTRFSINELRTAANGAAQRSNEANGNGRSAAIARTPLRLTPIPISDEDAARAIANISDGGWPGFFNFSDGVRGVGRSGNGADRDLNNQDYQGNRVPGAGWRLIVRNQIALFAKTQKIIEMVGDGPYQINSAYRSPQYDNAIKGKPINSPPGGSKHISCTALDISMSPEQAARWIPLASANGFGGIAYYTNSRFLHIDLRDSCTSWNHEGGRSRELQNIHDNHINNLYRR